MRKRWIVVATSLSLPLLLAASFLILQTAIGRRLHPTVEAAQSAVTDLLFLNSGQALGNSDSRDVALGDLDGDGDLDAFVANHSAGNRIWLNGGNGFFIDSQQTLGSARSKAVALGDLDGLNGLDAFVANDQQSNRIWLNNGSAVFSDSGQLFDPAASSDIALGDLDGTGSLDALIVNGSSVANANTVWLNNGTGVFSRTLQELGASWSEAASVGPLDNDDDLDAFIANGGSSNNPPDEVWLNEGSAVFSDTGQLLGNSWTLDVALAKLDQNESLDAFTVNWAGQGNRVYYNDGSGSFTDSGQSLGNSSSTSVAVGDVDGDGDVDALVGNWQEGNRIWLNDGQGSFSDSGLVLGSGAARSVALGDLDGDGDLDAFIANFGSNEVWFNGNRAFFDVDRQQNEFGKDYYYSAQDEVLLPVTLQQPAPQAVSVHVRIKSISQTLSETMLFEAGQQLMMLNLVRAQPAPSEEYTLTLHLLTAGETPTATNQTDQLSFYFVDEVQGPQDCLLCFNDWLGRIVGLEPIFYTLHHLDLSDQRDSAQWRYYRQLFKTHTPELIDIVTTHPLILWQAISTLNEFTPAIQALDSGEGSDYVLSQGQVDDAVKLLDDLSEQANSGLSHAIEREKQLLDLPSFAGLTMDQVWDNFVEKRPNDELFITFILK